MRIEGGMKEKVRVIPEVAVRNRGAVQDSWRFGIGERIYLAFDAPVSGAQTERRWQNAFGSGELAEHAGHPGEAIFYCPDTSGHVRLELAQKVMGRQEILASVEFEVIKPSLEVAKYEDINNEFLWHPYAGFRAAFMLLPDSVSFARVILREWGRGVWMADEDNRGGANGTLDSHKVHGGVPEPLVGCAHTSHGNAENWFLAFDPASIPAPAGRHLDHHPRAAIHPAAIDGGQGLEVIRSVGGVSGTVGFIDRVFNSFETQGWNWLDTHDPNAAGMLARYHLDIDVQYKALAKDYHDPGSGDTGQVLATNTHACEVRRDGTVKVSKGPRGRGAPAHFEWRNPHIRLNT